MTTSPSSAPHVVNFTLANGLDVVVIPDHRAPVVTHMVWYRNGAADDPPGKSGIAHFLEHLMFKGTKRHPKGEFSEFISEVGGTENAFTGNDFTAYFQQIAKQHLKACMAFEADRMTGLTLTDDIVAPERDVVLEERRMHCDTDPGAQLGEAVQAALFTHHPYGIPVIGWGHEIEGLKREDALAYYKRFYTPENAILVVAGDVEPDEARALAEETYGKIKPRGAKPERVRPMEPPTVANRLVTVADDKVEQPGWQRHYLAPSARTAPEGEAEALELLAHLFGGGQTSFLYRTLVIEQRIAVSAWAYYHGAAVDQSRFIVNMTPAPGVSLEALDKAFDQALARFAHDGIDAGDLERAKTRMVADAIYARDSQSDLARWYGSSLAIGQTLRDVEEWPARIERVTAGDVTQAARRWLDHKPAVTGYLMPLIEEAAWELATSSAPGSEPRNKPTETLMQKHLAVSTPHSAVNVDVVTSPRGLKFWLVPSHAVPLVSLEFAMRGGSAQDPADKAGLGALMSGLLDEGAGELDSQAFHRALDEIAVEMSFHCDRDHWSGRMRTLTKNLDRAAELLRLAVNAPRFDQEPFDRVREHMNARLRHDANDPATLASRNWRAKSFPHHPYGQPAEGTLETLARIERTDLVKAASRGIARDQLLIAVVGAIEEKEAAALVDRAFADLPAKGDLQAISAAAFAGLGAIDRIDLDVPQSTIRFGRPALKRDDPDFIPSVVAAHVLGGSGSMTSRLFREVREKRGLAYTVFGTFYSLEQGAYFYGGTTTKNERARESFDVASAEIRDVALNGLNKEELEKGKTYLIGSYPLRFDTSAKIASQLVHIQLERRAPEWLIERNREIAAVTMASVKRAAHRAFGDGSLHTTVVGRPEGF